MKRKTKSYQISNREKFIDQSLGWADKSSHFSYFNNNNIPYPSTPFEEILTIGCLREIAFHGEDDFQVLKNDYIKHQSWLVGYLGYDLKNQLERLQSNNIDIIKAPNISFYEPETIINIKGELVSVTSVHEPDGIFHKLSTQPVDSTAGPYTPITTQCRMEKEEYINKVKKLQQHIEEGDIYEINFCMEFFAEKVAINPINAYQQLTDISPTPFSVLQKTRDTYLICSSPERFMKKEGPKLISQPIKGTIKRGTTALEDEQLKLELRNNEKELAENMMIVDLVRNDLAKSSKTGTVKVEEMFGIYTFRTLHQMISSVSSQINDSTHFIDAIKNAFPMGSMTGAPKIKVMELIEKYELSKRGIYSGAAGFIKPNGDFDFNVVIRSIVYNQSLNNLSFHVGSAITYDAIAEAEYEECLLKAKAILETLGA